MVDYSGKEKTIIRKEFRNFITNYFSSARTTNAKVLTLLGPTNYELEQIWDPLGIKRNNITVIEQNPDTHKLINEKNLGINLIQPQSIDEYIQTTKTKFDIINLDYTGYLNAEKIKTLQEIGRKTTLGEEGIIATWYSGKREKKEPYTDMMIHYLSTIVKVIEKKTDASYLMMHMLEKLSAQEVEKVMQNIKEGTIPRDVGLTVATQYFLSDNFENGFPPVANALNLKEQICSIVEKTEQYKQRNKNLVDLIMHNEDPIEAGHDPEIVKAFKNLRYAALHKEERKQEDRIALVKYLHEPILEATEELVNKYLGKLELARKIQPWQKNLLSKIITLSGRPNYLPTANQKFKYISEDRTPMFVDFNYLKDFNTATLVPIKLKNKEKLQLHIGILTSQKFWKQQHNFGREYTTALFNTIKHPFEKRKEIICEKDLRTTILEEWGTPKNAVNNLLKTGQTYESINKLFPEFTLNQLPRIKAVLTMKEQGTQMGRPKKQTETYQTTNEQIKIEIPDETHQIMDEQIKLEIQTETHKTEENLETRTKIININENQNISNEEIMLLLQDNYAPAEIAEEFKINVWKIRGLKAYLTKQKNNEVETNSF